MGGAAKQFLIVVAAGIAATLLSTWLINNVRPVRRAIGSL